MQLEFFNTLLRVTIIKGVTLKLRMFDASERQRVTSDFVSKGLTGPVRGRTVEDLSSSLSSVASFEDFKAVNGVVGLIGISLVSSMAAEACRDAACKSGTGVSGSDWPTGEAVN